MRYANFAMPSTKLRTVLLLMTVLFAYSCKSQKAITETLHIRTEKEIIRDTVITIQPDSAVLEAMLMCDSNNQVLLRQLKVYEGKRLSYDVTIDSTNRALKVVCQEDSIREKVQVKDKLIQDSTKVTTTEYVEVEKPMTAWNHFLIVCGWILLIGVVSAVIILVIIIVWKLVKR